MSLTSKIKNSMLTTVNTDSTLIKKHSYILIADSFKKFTSI